MKKIVASILAVSVFGMTLGGCATPHQAQGTGVGAAIGGIAGALIDRKNPWRGALIGGGLGAVAGASFTEVSSQGTQQAAKTWKTVEYRTDDGRDVYRAEPVAMDARTKCKKVRERVWQDGQLVKDDVKEICTGEKVERGY
jgi:outer membrane lipoprotein SlyB